MFITRSRDENAVASVGLEAFDIFVVVVDQEGNRGGRKNVCVARCVGSFVAQGLQLALDTGLQLFAHPLSGRA